MWSSSSNATSGTLAGRRLEWEGIGRFTFEGERVVDVVGRWDNLELLAAIDPVIERTAFAQAAAELAAEGVDRAASG